MWFYLLLLAIGFALLIKGADIVVKYASHTARLLGVSNFMIGLTLVAFSTTLPELTVSLMSAFSGVVDIAVGTTLGSIIANPALILALAAVFVPLVTNRSIIRLNYILLIYLLILSLLLIDGLVWYEGLILLILFAFYMRNLIKRGGGTGSENKKKKTKTQYNKEGVAKYIVFKIIGGGLVVAGAKLLIDSTINLSIIWGVPEIVIAIIAVAIGTSLPELAVALTAAFKKMVGISIGDILGANMFNVMVIGLTSLVSTIPITTRTLTMVVPVVLIVNTLLLLFMS
ncbi:MAG: calcium/sodium antiporter, partial [Candidatus Aenigmatarchaeota archaeon]